ncbi:hybrid-cluster NAD(P)-dependent oxidoreductase [Mesorhizobium sp.]|uniref:hybrid-cluster NAD(P)-dependent oxidoreductase n=1 Tax=Mesorhizobium sp. TaxID=1871066 RepID=UPI0025C51522|nr:hybrid-cluster NAD(P)-dependent oxidoreductase [Mesorhizobium sp.]
MTFVSGQSAFSGPVSQGEIPSAVAEHILEVINVVDEAPNVKTFTFRSVGTAPLTYEAGQFITLELPVCQGPIARVYTLSSTPSRPMSVSVTAKAQGASVGTRWMFENLVRGSVIKARGPSGRFVLGDSGAKRHLFVSAGSGITPTMSMLRWLSDATPDVDVVFINCSRTPEEIIFRRELELLDQQMPNLRLGFIVEKPGSFEGWSGLTGLLDVRKLNVLAPDLMDREVYCCGPVGFMRGVQTVLDGLGFPVSHYHEENFAPIVAEPSDAPAAETSSIAPRVVRFNKSDAETVCAPGETVLSAARRSGVQIVSVCEMGICGTCKVRKTSGDVQMTHAEGISDDEVHAGYILACCAKPVTSVEVEA